MASPKILLVTTCRWQFAARLGMALAACGCVVDAVCPGEHPILKTRTLGRHYLYRGLRPLGSIQAAIEDSAPDLLVPCDDRATFHLQELYAQSPSPALREVIARSLGAPDSFAVTLSRTALLSAASQLAITTPETATVTTPEGVREWLEVHGFPAYLKADGSSGGTGVRRVTCFAESERAFAELSAPPSFLRAAKRTIIDRDLTLLLPCLRQSRPAISLQRAIVGRDANTASFCWKGEVLATIAVEVLRTRNQQGPSTVVRVIEHTGMQEAVQKLAHELGLSGFFGLDFMIDELTGKAYLIEMNPRATQIAHFALGAGRDLPAALAAAVSGEPYAARPEMTGHETIALFPQEWQRDPGSIHLRSGYHDVPWQEPALVRMAIHSAPRWRRWLTAEHWQEVRRARHGVPSTPKPSLQQGQQPHGFRAY